VDEESNERDILDDCDYGAEGMSERKQERMSSAEFRERGLRLRR
jgi:hypothetical protein